MNKVVLIGIDGGTFDLIKPLVRDGKLPTFKKLLDGGVHGNLKTTIPCLSLPAIPSMFSGMNPGKLGVFGFLKKDGSSVTYGDIGEDYIWDIVARKGRRSCIVDVTGTYPPMMENGVMISGSAPSEQSEYVYPKELKPKVRGFYSEFDHLKSLESNPQKNRSEILRVAVSSQRKKWKTFKSLMENGNFDFGVFWIVQSDDIQHFYWGVEDVILKFYKEIDGLLNDLIVTFGNYNIIVVSDHGFHSGIKHYFHVNSWLREKGYLKMKGRKLTQWLIYRISTVSQRLWRSLPRKAKYFLLKFLSLSSSRTSLGAGDAASTSGNFFLFGIDWENTVIYADSTSIGLRIKAKNQKLYDHLRSKIIGELKSLRDSSGNPVIREVWKREEIFWGKYSHLTPDVILLMAEDYQMNVFLSESIIAEVESKRKKRFRGDHLNARNGVFSAFGPIFKSNCEIRDLSILDVAPTVLHIMGCELQEEMDGKVITEAFNEESGLREKEIRFQKHKVKAKRSKKLASEERDKMRERLKALGYLG